MSSNSNSTDQTVQKNAKSLDLYQIFSVIKSLLGISALAIFLDRLSKFWALGYLENPQIITSFAQFRLEKNFGVAFSIPLPQLWLIYGNALMIIAIVTYLGFSLDFQKTLSRFVYAIFLGGAIGNWLDRWFYGYVIDFIAIGHFPVFNLADSFITVAVFLLVLFYDKIKRTN